jgi:hypothetical protein
LAEIGIDDQHFRAGGLRRRGGLFQMRAIPRTRTNAEKSRARRMAVARPIPWLAPVTIATDLDISILLHSKAQVSVVDHDHLSVGLVGLHDAVRLTDLVEAENPISAWLIPNALISMTT